MGVESQKKFGSEEVLIIVVTNFESLPPRPQHGSDIRLTQIQSIHCTRLRLLATLDITVPSDLHL